MQRRRFIGGMVSSGTVLLAGCSGGGDDDGGGNGNGDQTTEQTTTEPGPANEVEAVNTSFSPIRIEVEPGATVSWSNLDSIPHTITADQFHDKAASWDWDERIGANGGGDKYTFEEEGVYEYYCTIHGKSSMCGAVLVGDVSLDQSLPCEDGE